MDTPAGYLENWRDYLPGRGGFYGDVVPLYPLQRYTPESGGYFSGPVTAQHPFYYPEFSLATDITECKEIQMVMRYDLVSGSATQMGAACVGLTWWDGTSYDEDSAGYWSEFYPIYEYMPYAPYPPYPCLEPIGLSYSDSLYNAYSVVDLDNNIHVHRWKITPEIITDKKFLSKCWGINIVWTPIGGVSTENFYFYSLHGCRTGAIIL